MSTILDPRSKLKRRITPISYKNWGFILIILAGFTQQQMMRLWYQKKTTYFIFRPKCFL